MSSRYRINKLLLKVEHHLDWLEAQHEGDRLSAWIHANGSPEDADAFARWLEMTLRTHASQNLLDDDDDALALVEHERTLATQLSALGLGEFTEADRKCLTALYQRMSTDVREAASLLGRSLGMM